MKSRLALIIAVSIVLLGIPVYAQHGHGGGGGASMGTHGHSMNSHSTSSSSAHSEGKQSSVSERLSDNTKLAGKLQSLLPAGTNLQQASQGFKNLGQFVAAVHVSHNLGIPFDQLKAKMTGPSAESLGKAIEQLKPAANAKAEAKKANKQADQDMDDSKSTS
ncbi:MAG TPA: hypothetical protein VNV88_13655 [Candidatus Solibacter sp.]|nr:hypothetical protein [Candidatus Solibacter sp.]